MKSLKKCERVLVMELLMLRRRRKTSGIRQRAFKTTEEREADKARASLWFAIATYYSDLWIS